MACCRDWDGVAVGWGSRKKELVDKIGDPSSIFEKIRIILRSLPVEFLPAGFDFDENVKLMSIVNPETGATITGECGDNIGRGGRTLAYFEDEAQPLTAKILTPSGWSTMSDMAVGSKVIGSDGRAAEVVAINDAGVHDVYRVGFSDGTSTECSPSHLWAVDRVWGKRGRSTLRTSEIAERYSYTSPGGQTQFMYRGPLSPLRWSSMARAICRCTRT